MMNIAAVWRASPGTQIASVCVRVYDVRVVYIYVGESSAITGGHRSIISSRSSIRTVYYHYYMY